MKSRAGLSAETVRRIRNVLSAIFRHAKRMNYFMGELPTSDIVLPKLVTMRRNPLTSEQVEAVKSFCDARTRLLIDFLCNTGVRIGEAAGLRWDAVNLTDSDIWHEGERVPPFCAFICRQYTRGEMKEVKTAKSRRMVPLTVSLSVQLLEWPGKKHETIFASRYGQPLSGKNHLRRALAPAAIKAGVPGIGWHHFRHTAATNTDTVLTLAQRMALLGHTRSSTTMQYTKSDLEKIRTGLESIQ
jgi:integrase